MAGAAEIDPHVAAASGAEEHFAQSDAELFEMGDGIGQQAKCRVQPAR